MPPGAPTEDVFSLKNRGGILSLPPDVVRRLFGALLCMLLGGGFDTAQAFGEGVSGVMKLIELDGDTKRIQPKTKRGEKVNEALIAMAGIVFGLGALRNAGCDAIIGPNCHS